MNSGLYREVDKEYLVELLVKDGKPRCVAEYELRQYLLTKTLGFCPDL